MPRNGSGTYTFPTPSFVTKTVISSSSVNANQTDIANEMTNSLPRDGQAAPTADIPFGGNKITGLGNGVSATDSTTLGQVQSQEYIWCGTAGGSKNALTLTPTPAITAYAAGQTFVFKSGSTASDDAVTVAISGLTTKAIQTNGAALSSSVIIAANKWYKIVYDGAAFQLSRIGYGGALSALDTVGESQLDTDAVTEAKIKDGEVTAAKLAFTALDAANNLSELVATAATARGNIGAAALAGLATQAFSAADGATGKQVVNISQFSSSTSGTEISIKLPGNVTIKGGNFTSSSSSGAVTFSAGFASANVAVIIQSMPSAARYANATAKSTSGFDWVVSAASTDQPFVWIAIGY